MGDKAALASLFVNNGVVDPKDMRRIYDEGGDVGDIKPAVAEASYPREREVLDLVDKSDADFVSRLKDKNRVTIPDWEGKGETATHKLGYAEVDGKYIVYPLVQNIDGKLYDFSDPQYGMDKGWQALDSALYAGDYVELPSKADARWFTESYKNHYPGFNKYDGKTEKSQKMVVLGKDDYLAPGELEAAVVTSDRKPKMEMPIDYFFPERNDVDNKIDTLRDVMQSMVDREKRKPTPVDILESYRSAYNNPFLANPFYKRWAGINRFDEGGDTEEVFDTLDPSVVSAGLSKRNIRKGSRIVRNVLRNLDDNGLYTPEQKKRMSEYIIRVQGGRATPSIPRVIEMRKGLKYKNNEGISGLERVLYGREPVKDIINDINSDHISYDDYGGKTVYGFSLHNYNGTIRNMDENYDRDIVDSYINGGSPYGGKEYEGKYNLGPYKNYISKNYSGRNVKSYTYGDSVLPDDVVERLDRYAYDRGDNSFVVAAHTDNGVNFDLQGDKGIVPFDAGGHLWQFIRDDDGRFYVRQSDSYDFEPNQYKKSYGKLPYVGKALSALDSAGNPVLVFSQWREADPKDLYTITNGAVNTNSIDEESINKAIAHNTRIDNGKFLNAVDNALTLMTTVTR